jgi:hypothetical protein
MRWAGHAVRTGKKKGAYRILIGNPAVMRLGNILKNIILKWVLIYVTC